MAHIEKSGMLKTLKEDDQSVLDSSRWSKNKELIDILIKAGAKPGHGQ